MICFIFIYQYLWHCVPRYYDNVCAFVIMIKVCGQWLD